jgi:hypothetical protein
MKCTALVLALCVFLVVTVPLTAFKEQDFKVLTVNSVHFIRAPDFANHRQAAYES